MRERFVKAASAGAVVAAVVACCARDARAHKLHLFVTVEGKVLRGEAYLSGGGRLRNAEVLVRGPGGEKLGVARTDAQGQWRFLGVLPLFDPPREDSKATIAAARAEDD